jgi:predicted MPP superfamily phosphohydrolase
MLRLLLSHRPEFAVAAEQAGFQLQLSGHTHGGQFFPWTWVARLFHRFYLGLIRYKNLWIYVSPGTGSWGPPLRLGTTPEVTLITLRRTNHGA